MAQLQAPSVPTAKPVSGKSSDTFNALKQSLSAIASWEMSPNTWDKIQIAYTTMGSDKEAKAFVVSLQIPTPPM